MNVWIYILYIMAWMWVFSALKRFNKNLLTEFFLAHRHKHDHMQLPTVIYNHALLLTLLMAYIRSSSFARESKKKNPTTKTFSTRSWIVLVLFFVTYEYDYNAWMWFANVEKGLKVNDQMTECNNNLFHPFVFLLIFIARIESKASKRISSVYLRFVFTCFFLFLHLFDNLTK